MHEAGLTADLLEHVIEEADRAGATRVTAVHVAIGPGFIVSPAAFRSWWAIITEGTRAEGSSIRIRRRRAEGSGCRLIALDVDDAAAVP